MRRAIRRHRRLATMGMVVLCVGATFGTVTAVGAEELSTDTTTATVETTTTVAPEAPPTEPPATETEVVETTPTTTEVVPTTIAQTDPIATDAQSAPLDLTAQNHTDPPDPPEECVPTGSDNPWESDERADPSGQCTDGNPSQGGPTALLALCEATFGNSVTSVFDSNDDSSPDGNADLTGVITAHTGGGTQVNITPQPGVSIAGVFVKAGNGYNAYVGNEPNMIGPLVGNYDPDKDQFPNYANISHWVACYSGSAEVTTNLTVVKTQSGYSENDTFTVDVVCTDDSFDTTITFTVDDEGNADPTPPGSNVISDIPDGVTCDVEETDDGNPDTESCDVATTVNGNPGTSIEDVDPETTSTVTFDNVLTCEEDEFGTLNVIKSVLGTPAGGTTFTVEVDCNDGTSHDRTQALNNHLVFSAAGVNQGPGTLAITGIPVGTQCTVTEPSNGGAISTSLSPTNGVVTIVADPNTTTVTVTNTFIEVEGDITVRVDVNKQVVGNVNPPNGTQFVVNVTCTGDATVNENLTFTYPNGLGVQSVFAQIPTDGSITCTVTETDPGGQILEGYKINGGSTQSGAPTLVLNLGNPDDAVTVVNDPSNEVEVGGISLPFTGSETGDLIVLGAGLLAAGAIALVAVRRRRQVAQLTG